MIQLTRVTTDDDIRGILALQQANLKRNLTLEEIDSQGFVTLEHSFEVMKAMNEAEPSIIAKDGNKVIGYAIVMLPEFRNSVGKLDGLFKNLSTINYDGKLIAEYNYVVVGQVCVGLGYRGIGLFKEMYDFYRSELQGKFDCCITDISAKNVRSRKAHVKVGFEVVESFFDEHAGETWEIILWDWRQKK